MGNAQFTLNEANAQLPIDKSFLQKYQKHVTTVDHALTGLARGIDVLQSTCRLFLQQYSKSTDGQVKDMSVTTSEEAVILIIQKIHECISDNKEDTIKSTKSFFSFIKETGKDYIENAEEAFASLSVNTYQSLFTEYKFQDDWYTDFYKKRNEILKKEIEMLQNESKVQQDLIENLKKQLSSNLDKEELKKQIKNWIEQNSHRAEGSVCESKCTGVLSKSTTELSNTCNSKPSTDENALPEQNIIIPRENMTLDKDLIGDQAMYESKLAELRKQVQILEEDKSTLQKELQEKSMITQYTKKKVMVQVYSRYSTVSTRDAEEDLFVVLRTEFLKRDLELTVMPCKRPGQVVAGCPLLVTTDHFVYSRRKNATIETAMSELDFKQDTAVLVFHYKDERDLPNELKLYDKQYKSLGGIIHFGHKSSLNTSPLNQESIIEVIAFIEKFGKIQEDVVETKF